MEGQGWGWGGKVLAVVLGMDNTPAQEGGTVLRRKYGGGFGGLDKFKLCRKQWLC